MITSWKQWLVDAESNSKGIGKSAYLTALAVRQLWKSREFLAEECGGVLDDLTSKLAKYSGRFALGLNDMLQMIDHFPKEADWESGRLDILRDETCKLLLGRATRKGDKVKRTVVSQAQYANLQRKYKELQVRFRQLESDYRMLIGKAKAKS